MKQSIGVIFISMLLTACQIAPSGLDRADNPLISFKQLAHADADCQCQTVRLGGKVLKATALKHATEIEVLSMAVDRFSAKPVLDSHSDGRFIVRLDGFIDPLSVQDHYITVKGVFYGKRGGKIDQADYIYPLIKADTYRVWQQVVEYFYDEDEWFDHWHSYYGRAWGIFPMWKPRTVLR